MDDAFPFIDPGPLQCEDFYLDLHERSHGIRKSDGTWFWVPAYGFRIRQRHSGLAMGTINLRIAHDDDNVNRYIGHIGYGVDERFRGRAVAARACQLILPMAWHHGIDPLVITCNPDNWPSRITCEKAGGRLVEVVPIPSKHPLRNRGEHFKCRYLFRPAGENAPVG